MVERARVVNEKGRRVVAATMVVALAAVAPCGAQEAPEPTSAEAGVRAAVAAYDEAADAKDEAELRRLMSPTFLYFTSSGAVRTRGEFIGFLTSPEYRPEFRERSEVRIEVTAGTAVVASRWRGEGMYGDTRFEDDQRCSLVLGRTDTGWLLVAEHCTPIG